MSQAGAERDEAAVMMDGEGGTLFPGVVDMQGHIATNTGPLMSWVELLQDTRTMRPHRVARTQRAANQYFQLGHDRGGGGSIAGLDPRLRERDPSELGGARRGKRGGYRGVMSERVDVPLAMISPFWVRNRPSAKTVRPPACSTQPSATTIPGFAAR